MSFSIILYLFLLKQGLENPKKIKILFGKYCGVLVKVSIAMKRHYGNNNS